jgi:catechol 2,3-dioxygenase-like lactoylglutathione lyase family enzyme
VGWAAKAGVKGGGQTMILEVDHAQITIPKNSEEEARKFYCDFLGLKEIEKPENRKNNGGFWLQVGATQVHVGTEDGFDRTKTKAHVAYRVDNLVSWRERFKERSIEIFESPPFPNAEAFEFRDPFGNRVELIQTR